MRFPTAEVHLGPNTDYFGDLICMVSCCAGLLQKIPFSIWVTFICTIGHCAVNKKSSSPSAKNTTTVACSDGYRVCGVLY